MAQLEYGPKDPDEALDYGLDFTDRLETSETISTAVFDLAPVSGLGTDSATATVSGAASLADAPIVRQRVLGGTAGWTYRLRATCTTNQGRTVVASALLPVREGA